MMNDNGTSTRTSFDPGWCPFKRVMILHVLLFIAVFFLLSGQPAQGQAGVCTIPEQGFDYWQIELEPFGSVRCPAIRLGPGHGFILMAEPGSNLNLDAFIYNAATQDLVGKSDDEIAEPFYEWRALEDGRYYIVVRNAGPQRGVARITVLSRESGKSLGMVTPKNAAKEPNSAVVNVYYATDRNVTGKNKKGTTYGVEFAEGDQVEFGIAKVSIPRAFHEMGELEGPSILRLEFRENPKKHIILLSATPEQPDSFYGHVSDRIAQSVRREAFVFIHGFNVSFEDALRRTAQISYDLGFDGAPILYSWPSHGELGLISYNKDGRNAELSVPHLRTFLEQLTTKTGARTIHLIAHSMGNRVAVKALASSPLSAGAVSFRIREVALMAPDIDAAEFRRLAVAMKASADRVTLYASSGDAALKLSQKLSGYPRAGEGGKHIVVIPGVIETIDSSLVDTSLLGVGHAYYADNSTILSDLFHLIRGESVRDRFRLIPAQNAQGQFWSFAPAAR